MNVMTGVAFRFFPFFFGIAFSGRASGSIITFIIVEATWDLASGACMEDDGRLVLGPTSFMYYTQVTVLFVWSIDDRGIKGFLPTMKPSYV